MIQAETWWYTSINTSKSIHSNCSTSFMWAKAATVKKEKRKKRHMSSKKRSKPRTLKGTCQKGGFRGLRLGTQIQLTTGDPDPLICAKRRALRARARSSSSFVGGGPGGGAGEAPWLPHTKTPHDGISWFGSSSTSIPPGEGADL